MRKNLQDYGREKMSSHFMKIKQRAREHCVEHLFETFEICANLISDFKNSCIVFDLY